MSKLETIPAEEGATLLPKPKSTGIRRVVAVSAMASFVIGVLAATAVRRTPVRHASNLQQFTYTYKDGSGRITYDHASDSQTTVSIDMGISDGSPMILWWPESDKELPKENLIWAGGDASSSGKPQLKGLGAAPGSMSKMAFDDHNASYPPPNAEGRRLWGDVTCPADMYDATGGDPHFWACGKGCAGGKYTDGTCNCACQCRSGSPAELRNSDGPCDPRGKWITIQNGEGLCVAASGTKNGKRIIAQKCKAGSSKQQWQIGPM